MANIGEVGSSVDDVFSRQAAELVQLLRIAEGLSDAMGQQFNAATVDSTNERVTTLHGHISRISTGLGALVTEVVGAQETSSELLEEWGVGGGTAPTTPSEAVSGVATPDKPAASSESRYDQTNPHRLSALHHRELYEGMGINLSGLGCIMLDTEPIVVSDIIAEEDRYYANDPVKYPHAKGVISEDVPHVTLLQGLLKPGPELQAEVDAILEGWAADDVTVREISYFAGADPNEPYDCIVAHLETTGDLKAGNARLQMLPHINMYPPDYRAHVSLAYIKRDPAKRDAYIKAINARYAGQKIRVTALNYGR